MLRLPLHLSAWVFGGVAGYLVARRGRGSSSARMLQVLGAEIVAGWLTTPLGYAQSNILVMFVVAIGFG